MTQELALQQVAYRDRRFAEISRLQPYIAWFKKNNLDVLSLLGMGAGAGAGAGARVPARARAAGPAAALAGRRGPATPWRWLVAADLLSQASQAHSRPRHTGRPCARATASPPPPQRPPGRRRQPRRRAPSSTG